MYILLKTKISFDEHLSINPEWRINNVCSLLLFLNRHDIAEILLKVALNTNNPNSNPFPDGFFCIKGCKLHNRGDGT